MLICALMPTYRRPQLVASALACFQHQTHQDKFLLICDESGEISPDSRGDDWKVLPHGKFSTLTEKYNFMAAYAFETLQADAIAVFQDDDVYLPEYLAMHARVLGDHIVGWSSFSHILVDGSGGSGPRRLRDEHYSPQGCFGCTAISRGAYERLGGFPDTPRADFDFSIRDALHRDSPMADCSDFGPPQFYFRWATTGTLHAESAANGPTDTDWMAKYQAWIDKQLGPPRTPVILAPQMDAETAVVLGG